MPGVRIVTDTTANLSREELEEHKIEVVPLYVNFPDEVIMDGSISNAVFFEKCEKAPQLPFTSQPSPGDFAKVYEKILNDGDEIVSIHISSGLSGTVESAASAIKMLSAEGISVVDSLVTMTGLAIMVLSAARAAGEGKSREEIVQMLEEMKVKGRTFLVPATLEYMKKGGRIGGAQALLGSIMQIKPILILRNDTGKIDTYAKARTMRKALERLVEELPQNASDVRQVAVLNADAEGTAAELKVLLQARLPDLKINIYALSAVIATHTGPGTVGFSFFPK